MGSELRLLEESGSDSGNDHRSVPEIAYKEYDYVTNREEVTGPLWEFQLKVNGEDLSYVEQVPVLGVNFDMLGIDIHLCWLKSQGAKIQLAMDKDECIGFLLYHLIADCIIYVRGLYLYPEYEGYGIGVGLINSLNKPIKKIIFQTQKERMPTRMLSHIGGRRQLIHEDNKLITWEMEWKNE